MQPEKPRSMREWLAGLPASSIGWVFVASGLVFWVGGASQAVRGLAHDRSLEQEGRVVDGTVLEKQARTSVERRAGRRSHEGGTIETHFLITFRFPVTGEELTDTAEVDKEVWNRLPEQGPIRVTYLPEKPEVHRVEGQEAEFNPWALLLWLAGGGLFLYVGQLLLAGKMALGSVSESED